MRKIHTALTPLIKRSVEDHHIGLRTRGILGEPYSLGWLPTSHPCQTACWRFDKASGKHVIEVSPNCYPTLTKGGPAEKTRVKVPQLYRDTYEHEAAHSLYTTKDLAALSKLLAADKIPWRLCNLFEDCRIETDWVRRVRKGAFIWPTWVPSTPAAKCSATGLLYMLKTFGAKYLRNYLRNYRLSAWERATGYNALPFYDRVKDYYWRRITMCRTTEALIPLLKEWIAEFPSTGDDTIEGEGGCGTGDLKESTERSGEGTTTEVKAADPKGAGSAGYTGTDQPDPGGEPTAHKRPENGSEPSHRRSGAGDPDSSDKAVIEKPEYIHGLKLAGMLAGAFKIVGPTKMLRATPSKRLNVRGLLRGQWNQPFIGDVHERGGKPHISMVFDCSGSMADMCFIDRGHKIKSSVDSAGRVLGRALSQLARSGKITGVIYASASGGCFHRTSLPCRDYEWAHFRGFCGSEGIGTTLSPDPKKIASRRSVFAEVAKHSKLAIVYTDGCITDARVDRAPLRAKGVYTLGVCCSLTDRTDRLKEHFDYALSRESLWALADALVRILRIIPSH